MGPSINETYDLQEAPETWGDAMKQAVKHFYASNGVLPNIMALHDELFDDFPKALEPKGFRILSVGIRQDILDQIEQREGFEDLFNLRVTIVVSPEDDYRLTSTLSDELGKMQFQLIHMYGLEHSED